jgi:predicted nucleic acid-binding protein
LILADSSVWIATLRGEQSDATAHLADATRDAQLIVGDLILVEVLQGARSDAHAKLLERTMRQFPVVSLLHDDMSGKAARYCRLLRGQGTTAKRTVDLIIAAYCIEHDHILLHRDRDYTYFEKHLGLRVL